MSTKTDIIIVIVHFLLFLLVRILSINATVFNSVVVFFEQYISKCMITSIDWSL